MSAGHSHHSHSHKLPSNEKYLWCALALTATFMLVEMIGGLITGSLALISDAAHMMTDTMALAIALVALRIAKRVADERRTFGYHRFEILAAAFNAGLLFLVAMYILYEAWQRLYNPPEIQSIGMLSIATFGLIVNLISMRLLSGGKDHSLNVKSAYLEVWSDMLGSFGVIVGAVLIRLTSWVWIDSVIAVAIGVWVLPRTWILWKESINILLEGVPEGMSAIEVQTAMLKVPGVQSVHDFHLWALTSGKASLTAHVVYDRIYSPEEQLLPVLKEILASKFAVYHTTLQFEVTPCLHKGNGCHYDAGEPHDHASHK